MADSNRSTNAHLNDIQDDDPFAELTRIMGHDPRAEAGKGEAAESADAGDDELAIDLESELMGDLTSFDEEEAEDEATAFGDALANEEGRPDAQDAANENVDEALSDLDMEMDFDAVFAEEEGASAAEPARVFQFPAHGPEHAEEVIEPGANADVDTERDADIDAGEEEGPSFLRIGAAQPEAEPEDAYRDAEARETAHAGENDRAEPEPIGRDQTVGEDDGSDVVHVYEDQSGSAFPEEMEDPVATTRDNRDDDDAYRTEPDVPVSDEEQQAAIFSEPFADDSPSEPAQGRTEDDAQEHFAPLYAVHQPDAEPQDRSDADDAEASEEPAEAFDYSRAAADRHDFLAETLEEESPETWNEPEDQASEAVNVAPEEAAYSPEPQAFETETAAHGNTSEPPDATRVERRELEAREEADLHGEESPYAASGYDSEPARPEDETDHQGDPMGVFAEDGARPMSTPSMMAPAAAMAALQASYNRAGHDDAREADDIDHGTQGVAVGGAQAATSTTPPEIETVDIADKPTALDDDLDIPDVKTEDDAPPAIEFDEFEAELAGAFGSLATQPDPSRDEENPAREPEPQEQQQPSADADAGGHDTEIGMAAASGIFAREPSADAGYEAGEADDRDARETGLDTEYAGAVGRESPDLYYDPAAGEEMPYAEESAGGGSRRRGILVASLVAIIAVIGGIGAFALSSGNDGPTSPAVVRADDQPVKVKPENPGGAKVPNQDSEVYQRVAGKEAQEPAQEKLVSTTEEPMDVTGPEPRVVTPQAVSPDGVEPSTSGKSEDRLAPGGEDNNSQVGNEVATVQARRVKTVVVKPDGTIVSAAENSAPTGTQSSTGSDMQTSAASAATAAGNSSNLTGVGNDVATNGGSSVDNGSEAVAATRMEPAANSEATSLAATGTEDADTIADDGTPALDDAAEAVDDTDTPSAPAPVPSARPAKPASPLQNAPEVASTGTESQPAAGAPTSEWSVQISSQPSVKAAQQSYQTMAQRYGEILSGQGVNIVRADIDGKGTYYRVRIPSSSKDDAIALCSKLKSAGGNCFVSK